MIKDGIVLKMHEEILVRGRGVGRVRVGQPSKQEVPLRMLEQERLKSETNDQVITTQIPGTIFVKFQSFQRWMTFPHIRAREPAVLLLEHCRLIY